MPAVDIARLADAASAADDRKVVVKLIDEISAALRETDRADPAGAGLTALLVRLLLKLGRVAEAAEALARGEHLAGPTVETRELASLIALVAGDYPAAMRAINESIMLTSVVDREALEVFRQKADILSSQGDFAGARSVLDNLPARDFSGAYFRCLRATVQSEADMREFEAIAMRALGGRAREPLSALYHYSILLRNAFRYDEAIAAARARFIRATEHLAFGSQVEGLRTGWRLDASVALSDLREELSAGGVDFFLVSGTLLGCVRENDILGHDKDLDVGVEESASMEQIRDIIRRSRRFLIRSIEFDDTIYVRHVNGVDIDIFRHFLVDGRLIHHGLKVLWWNTPFDLIEHPFLGASYKIPRNYDLYLTENYGDWRTPKPEFETFVDTPNMEVTDEPHLVWYFLIKMADYYLLGRLGLYKKVWAALQRLQESDAQLAALAERAARPAARDHAVAQWRRQARGVARKYWAKPLSRSLDRVRGLLTKV